MAQLKFTEVYANCPSESRGELRDSHFGSGEEPNVKETIERIFTYYITKSKYEIITL